MTSSFYVDECANKFIKASESWKQYIDYLKEKYPPKDGEEFKLTCEWHKKIDAILGGQ